MSTDLHDRPRQPSPDEGDKPQPPKSSLSIAQIVGGALAAMTAAALGSRLSLAGTVLGAAFASVIAAVAGALYTASLRRTSQGVSTVIARVRPTQPPTTATASPAGSTTPGAAPTSNLTDDTSVDAPGGWAVPPMPAAAGSSPTTPGPSTPVRRSPIGWKKVLVGALLMFVVAALVLTGIELATGRALSGGNGTTVGQVAEPDTRPSTKPTPRPTPTRSATPIATASAAPSVTAAPSSTPTDEPSAEPSASSTPAPSDTPTTPVPSATPTVAPSAPAATPAS